MRVYSAGVCVQSMRPEPCLTSTAMGFLFAVVAQAERRPVKAGHIDDTQERPCPACPRMD
nr:MAG TPA: hypothetical protein [Caudoviricetes sp.]